VIGNPTYHSQNYRKKNPRSKSNYSTVVNSGQT
jgi:hypothetical protein